MKMRKYYVLLTLGVTLVNDDICFLKYGVLKIIHWLRFHVTCPHACLKVKLEKIITTTNSALAPKEVPI